MKAVATIRVYKDVNVVIPELSSGNPEREVLSAFGDEKVSMLKEKGYSVEVSTVYIRELDTGHKIV